MITGRIKKALLSIFLLAVFYFLVRHFLPGIIMQRLAAKIESRYGFHLTAASQKVTGFAGIQLSDLVILPHQGDTLIRADSVFVRPSLLNLFIGRLKLNELDITNMIVHLVCVDSVCNYRQVKKETVSADTSKPKADYARSLKGFFRNAFDLLPGEISLKNINIRIDNDSIHENISIPFYQSSDEHLAGIFSDNMQKAQWNITGVFSGDDRTFDVKIFPEQPHSKGLPLVKNFFGAYFNFDSLQILLEETRFGSPLQCKGRLMASNLRILHPKLSGDTIHINDFTEVFSAKAGKNFLELDSASYIQLNKLFVMLYARYENHPVPAYSLAVKTGKQDADNFFSSLPAGMFTELQGIEADGMLGFTLRFHLNSSEPDSLFFDSQMEKEKFRLRKYGDNSLLKMNREFMYTAYERKRPVKSFTVGPSNPDFVPLEKISPYLRNAVLTSEDGSFFYHNGFNEDAFRKSIAANYKAGKFVRGGSTITMQLVKNVYLTRHKTIARKAEEAFLVWLIESNNLCTKERMFEVYLNIIELGPGIYGVKDASRFYFDKLPDELSLSESIFLASLLPHPKWFKYSFDAAGNLKPHLADYYRVVSNFMLKKGLITEEEYTRIEPRVELKGPAKEIVPTDILPPEDLEESD